MKNIILAVAVFLTACAGLGLPTPTTFNERLAAAYGTVTEVRSDATILLSAGKITPADAQNVQNQADNAKAALDLARTMSKGDLPAANTRLTATIAALTALQAYLASRKGK